MKLKKDINKFKKCMERVSWWHTDEERSDSPLWNQEKIIKIDAVEGNKETEPKENRKKSGEGLVKVIFNGEHIPYEKEELTCVIIENDNNT